MAEGTAAPMRLSRLRDRLIEHRCLRTNQIRSASLAVRFPQRTSIHRSITTSPANGAGAGILPRAESAHSGIQKDTPRPLAGA